MLKLAKQYPNMTKESLEITMREIDEFMAVFTEAEI